MNSTYFGKTPSQTIGPFFKIGTEWLADENLVTDDHAEGFLLKGTLYDGAGDPIPDGMIEIWQADGKGNFSPEPADSWTGFGRRLTDQNGQYQIRTIKPGIVPTDPGDQQAPYILMVIFARGLMRPVFTRVYFPDEAELNSMDPLLCAIDDAASRATLIATKESPKSYIFDIRLQDSTRGPETQFVQFGF